MEYKLFDKDNNDVTPVDLEEKQQWCEAGKVLENKFIAKYGETLSLAINPEKDGDDYVADLINTSNGNLGDLKTVNTPFFMSRSLYGLDPQYTVTFDVKDYNRYNEFYPSLELYFWVDWIAVRFEGKRTIKVKPMEGVWEIGFQELKGLCKTRHVYPRRAKDTRGNGKEVFVLNILTGLFKKII